MRFIKDFPGSCFAPFLSQLTCLKRRSITFLSPQTDAVERAQFVSPVPVLHQGQLLAASEENPFPIHI
jgi:hypothetical protein